MSKKPLRHNAHNDPFPDLTQVASASEFTGMMPAQIPSMEGERQLMTPQDAPDDQPPKKK